MRPERVRAGLFLPFLLLGAVQQAIPCQTPTVSVVLQNNGWEKTTWHENSTKAKARLQIDPLPTNQDVIVTYRTVPGSGSATAGTDYTAISSTQYTFPAWTSTAYKDIEIVVLDEEDVNPNNDDVQEGAETFTFEIWSVENGNLDWNLASVIVSITESDVNAPTITSAAAESSDPSAKIRVEWVNNASPVPISYEVYRRLSTGPGAWVKAGEVSHPTLYCIDTALSPGTEYDYIVYAKRGSCTSSCASSASPSYEGEVQTVPAAPFLTATPVSTSRIDLSWNGVYGDDNGYEIERSPHDQGAWTQIATPAAGVTSYQNSTGLSAGTQYDYRIRAKNGAGASAWSTVVSAWTYPNPPTSFGLSSISTSQIDASWNAVSGATSYQLWRLPAGSTWSMIASGFLASPYLDQTGLSAGTRYYYKMRALNPAGWSAYTSTLNTWTRPAAPTLAASSISASQIDLSWNSVTGDGQGYEIERCPHSAGTWTQIATRSSGSTSYQNTTGLSAGTEYDYRIRAKNAGGVSAWSNVASQWTLPAAPTGLSVQAASSFEIDLTWTDNSSGELGYKIDRKIGSDSWDVPYKTLTADMQAYNDISLTASQQYYYRVYAYNSGGESAKAEGNATTQQPKAQFSAAGASGPEDGNVVSVYVSLDASSTQDVTVDFTVGAGTAVEGADYNVAQAQSPPPFPEKPRRLQIPCGNTQSEIKLTVLTDSNHEQDETVFLDLVDDAESPQNALLGSQTRYTHTIEANGDPPTAQFSSSSSQATENDATVPVVVTLSGTSYETITVDYSASPGDPNPATAGADYSLAAGCLTFNPGDLSKNINLQILEDSKDEYDEKVRVTLDSATSASLDPDPADPSRVRAHTILDDGDPWPQATLSAVGAASGAEAGLSKTYRISLSYPAEREDVSVAFTEGGTAEKGEGKDYTTVSPASPVAFSREDQEKDVTVTFIDDAADEFDETAALTIDEGDSNRATAGSPASATYTIVDNDPIPVQLADIAIDSGSLARLNVDDSAFEPDMTYTYSWQLTAGAGANDALTDAATKWPLYADYPDGNSPVEATATLGHDPDDGDTNNDSMDIAVSDAQAPEFGPIENLNDDVAGGSGTIEMGCAWDRAGVVGLSNSRGVAWSKDSGGAYEIWAFPDAAGDHYRICADGSPDESERLLALGGDDVDQILISSKEAYEAVSRIRSIPPSAGQWSGSGETIATSGGGPFIHASAAKHGGQWCAALMTDGIPEVSPRKGWVYRRDAQGTWADFPDAQGNGIEQQSFPTLVSGRDGVLYLVFIDASATALGLAVSAPGAMSGWDSSSIDSGVTSCDCLTALKDSNGTMWCLVANGTTISAYLNRWNVGRPGSYGGWQSASGDLLAGKGATSIEPGHFADADDNGWVYIAAQTSSGTNLFRAEATGPGSVAVTTTSLDVSNRSIPGSSDSHGEVYFEGGRDGFVTWQPALNHPGESFYLAGRPYKNSILLDEGREYTFDPKVDVGLDINASSNIEIRIFGSDVTDVLLNGTTVGKDAWFAWPGGTFSLQAVISDSPRGAKNDAGKQTVWAQFRDATTQAATWEARDAIVYLADSDVRITSVEIADASYNKIESLVKVAHGAQTQFHALMEYEPTICSLVLDADHLLAWGAANGIGGVTHGLFTAEKEGIGELTAWRRQDNVGDAILVQVLPGGALAEIKVLPQEDILLGLNDRFAFWAKGYDASGHEVEDLRLAWDVAGPGQITQSGVYSTPGAHEGGEAEIQAFDERYPDVVGAKKVRIDGIAPRILGLGPAGEVAGEVTFGWRLATDPEEESFPVEMIVVLDEKTELGRARAESETATSFQLVWQSTDVPDGPHTARVVATDARGNSNADAPAEISFVVNNPAPQVSVGDGVDWLLEHQWRAGDADYGSWRESAVDSRPLRDRIAEATFALNALHGEDFSHLSRDANAHSGARVTVAEAYHDGVVWLGRQVEAGAIEDFALRCMAMETLALARARKSRLARERSAASAGFEDALGCVDAFLEGDPDLLSRLGGDGGFAVGEESLSTRFETLLALRVVLAAGRDDLAETLLERCVDYFKRNVDYDEQGDALAANDAGWANVRDTDAGYADPVVGRDADVFYLSAEIAATLQRLAAEARFDALGAFDAAAFADAYGYLWDAWGSGWADDSVVDPSAGVYAYAMNRLFAGEATVGDAAARACQVSAKQADDGSWNGRALDTAWALRALRAELAIAPASSGLFSPSNAAFKVNVANNGVADAKGVSVSLLCADPKFPLGPEALLPHERSERVKAVSVSRTVGAGETQSFTIAFPAATIPPKAFFMADAQEGIAEYDEGNNVLEWSLPEAPNLVVFEDGIHGVSAGGGPPVAGSEWHLDVEVWNQGQFPVSLSDVELQVYEKHPLLDGDSRYLMWEHLSSNQESASTLLGGEKITVRFIVSTLRADLQTPGAHEIYAWLDPRSGRGTDVGLVGETNERDNIAGRVIRVYEREELDLPDLTIQADGVRYGPRPLYREEGGWLEVRVDNVGKGRAEDVELAVTYDALGTRDVLSAGTILGGQSKTLRAPLAVGAGEHTLRLEADPSNAVVELNEGNNDRSAVVVAHQKGASPVYDLAIAREDIAIETDGQRVQFAQGLIHNLRDGIDAEVNGSLDVSLEYYDPVNDPDNEDPLQVEDDPIEPFTLAGGGTYAHPDRAPTPRPSPTSGEIRVVVDFSSGLKDSSATPTAKPLEYSTANNAASRDFCLDQTNLRVVEIQVDPDRPALAGADYAAAPADVTVVVANGDGTAGFETAAKAHLRIFDEITGEEIAYWNALVLEPVDLTGGVATNFYTLTVPDVPFAAGSHYLKATIDPINFYIETDETDNEKALSFEVDDVEGRPLPDLAVASDDVAFRESGGYLVVEAAVRNLNDAENAIAAATAENVRVMACRPLSPETEILGVPFVIPRLAGGGERKAILATNLPAQTSGNPISEIVRVRIDPGGEIAERSETNNEADRESGPPNAPESIEAIPIFTTVLVAWAPAPPTPTPLTDVVGCRLARYLADGGEELQSVWRFNATTTECEDTSSTIQTGSNYRYRVWTIGANGRLSEARQADAQPTDEGPVITHVNATPVPSQTATSVIVVSGSDFPVTISGTCASGASAVLTLNGEEYASAEAPSRSFQFDVLQTDASAYNTVYAVSRKTFGSNGDTYYTAYSNKVVLLYDKYPDLRYEWVDGRPNIVLRWTDDAPAEGLSDAVMQVWECGGLPFFRANWKTWDDVREINLLRGKWVRLRASITNANAASADTCDVRFLVEFGDGPPIERLTTLAGPIDGTNREALSRALFLPEDAEATTVTIKIDYYESAGQEAPGGRIIESSETNNTAVYAAIRYKNHTGKAFWAVSPWARSDAQDNRLVLDPVVDLISASKPGGPAQAIHFDKFVGGAQQSWGGNREPFVSLATGATAQWVAPRFAADPWVQEEILDGQSIYIHGATPFAANLWVNEYAADDAFMLIPADQLGSRYVVVSTPAGSCGLACLQVLAIASDTRIRIWRNAQDVPTIPGRQLTTTSDGSYYEVDLDQKGLCYVWQASESPDPHSNDPTDDLTGIAIESVDKTDGSIRADRPIAVFSNVYSIAPWNSKWAYDVMCTMPPPVDGVGGEYVIPVPPLAGAIPSSQERGPDHEAGEYLNNFVRIAAAANATVTVDDRPSTNLVRGQWIDVSGVTTHARNLADDSYRDHRIVSTGAPALVYQFFSSTGTSDGKPRYATRVDKLNEVGAALLTWPGDPNLQPQTPTERFSRDEFVHCSPAGKNFSVSGNRAATEAFLQSVPGGADASVDALLANGELPRHYVSVVARMDGEGTPPIYHTKTRDPKTRTAIGAAGPRSTGWRDLGEGRQSCTFAFQVQRGDDPGDFYLYNPERIPIGVQMQGIYYAATYGLPAAYQARTGDEAVLPSKDLEVVEEGIRLPYLEGAIEGGEPATVRVEIMNNGSQNVAALDGATISAWECGYFNASNPEYPGQGPWNALAECGAVSVPAGEQEILAKRQAPYIFEFTYTPDPTKMAAGYALKVQATLPDEETTFNNTAYKPLAAATLRFPNLGIDAEQGIAFDPPESDPSPEDAPVKIEIPVFCEGLQVEQSEVEVTVARTIPEPSAAYPACEMTMRTLARFTPETVVSGSGGFRAETTAVIEWEVPSLNQRAGYYAVTAEINPDRNPREALSTVSTAYDDNVASDEYMYLLPKGNLRLQNLTSNAVSPTLVGETVALSAMIQNDRFRAFASVPVRLYLGDPRNGSGRELKRAQVSLARDETIGIDLTWTIDVGGDLTLYVGVNPLGTVEERYAFDNWRSVSLTAVEARMPDLSLGTPEGFALPATVTRGNIVDLDATIANIGCASVWRPYKFQIIDGSPESETGDVLFEGVFNAPLGAEQAADASLTTSGQWNTYDAALGEHTIFLAIDPPSHLAATPTEPRAAASDVPLRARAMAPDEGITIVQLPDALAEAPVEMGVCVTTGALFTTSALLATGAIATTNTVHLIGKWDSEDGFVNEDVDGSGLASAWQTSFTEPALLIFSTTDGEPFPVFDSAWSMRLVFDDDLATPTVQRTAVDIVLPANDAGQWGAKIAFWLASDGSIYFGREHHLARNYLPDWVATRGLIVDMSPADAMRNRAGSVAELEERNNAFSRTVAIIEEARPNFVVQDVRTASASTLVGEAVEVEADVANAGAAFSRPVPVSLGYASLDSPEIAKSVGTGATLGGLDHDETQTVRFTWRPNTLTGVFELTAQVDPDDLTAELSEDDNDGFATATIAGTTTFTLQDVSPMTFAPDAAVPVTATVDSSEATSATVCFDVLSNDTGELADCIDLGTSVPFSLQGARTLEGNWSSAIRYAGEYIVRACLYRIVDGLEVPPPIAVDGNVFEIQADKGIACSIAVDRSVYDLGDPIRMNVGVRNASSNYRFPALKAIVEIRDRADRTVWRPAAPQVWTNVDRAEARYARFAWSDPDPLDTQLAAFVTAFEDLNGNDAPDPGEVDCATSRSFAYGGVDRVAGEVDIVDGQGNDVLYTSSSLVDVNLAALGDVDMSTNGLMLVSDSPIFGPGILVRNRMPGSSFEENAALDLWHAGGSQSAVALVADAARFGARSLWISGDSGDWAATSGARGVSEAGIAVDPACRYTVSFYYQSAGPGDGFFLSIHERDATGALVNAIEDGVRRASYGKWSRAERTFVTRANAASVGLRFTFEGTGSQLFHVDGVQIEEGGAATRWIDGSGFATPGRFVNLLANPALTLDLGTAWRQAYPDLDAQSDETAGNGVPDGWRFASGLGSSIVSAPSLPGILQERGLDKAFAIQPSATTATLSQGMIPVRGGEDLAFSVYASGDSQDDLTLKIVEYDAQDAVLNAATFSTTTGLRSTYERYALTLSANPSSARVSVEISALSDATVCVAAAQLEPGQAARTWVGWTPFSETTTRTLTDWNLKDTDVEGEKRVEAQFLDGSLRPGRRPSRRLSLDETGSGVLGAGVVNGSYAATAESASALVTMDEASALFDGNAWSGPALGDDVETATVEVRLATRPVVTDLWLRFDDASPTGCVGVIEGAFEPGDWTFLTSFTLETNPLSALDRHIAPDADWQYPKYRLRIAYGQATTLNLTEIDFRGFVRGGRDNIVYDATPPTGRIVAPAEGATAGQDSADLEISASDNVSGLREAAYKVEQGGVQKIAWTPLTTSEAGAFRGAIDLTPLSDGTAVVTAAVWDRAGNRSADLARNLTVDRTPPALTNARFENATTGDANWVKGGDTAWLRVDCDDDGVTTGMILADLQVFALGAAVPAGAVNGGAFTWDLSSAIAGAGDGAATVTLSAADPYGNLCDSVSAATTVDNSPPAVALTPLTPDPCLSSNATFTGTATDNSEGRVASVERRLDGGAWQAATASDGAFDGPSESFEINLTGLSDDAHTVCVRATDAAGNVGESRSSDTFEVDGVRPQILATIQNMSIEPLDMLRSAQVARDGDRIDVQAAFDASRIATETLQADLTAFGLWDGMAPVDFPTTSTARWIVGAAICAPDAQGRVTAVVSALDLRDRATSASASLTVDNAMPWSEFTNAPPDLTSQTAVTLSGAAYDQAPGTIGLTDRVHAIEYRLDDGAWTAATLTSPPYDDASSETFDVALSGLEDTTHTVWARVTDSAGNVQSEGLTSDTFVVDSAPVEIAFVAVVNLATTDTLYIHNGAPARVVAYLTQDDLGTSEAITADLTNLGLSSTEAPDSFSSGTAVWEIGADDLATSPTDGVTTVTVRTTDGANNAASFATTIIADNTFPTATIANYGADPTTDVSPPIGGLTTDTEPGTIARVELRVDGGDWEDAVSRDAANWTGGFDSSSERYDCATTMSVGSHTVEVRAVDRAGNRTGAPYPSLTIEIASPSTQIEYAELRNDSVFDAIHPEIFRYFRNGDDLKLIALLGTEAFDGLPSSTTIHADLTGFGLSADVLPDAMADVLAEWYLTPGAATPLNGIVPAWVWTDDFSTAKSEVSITADNTSPTMNLCLTNPGAAKRNSAHFTGTATDVGSGVREVVFQIDDGAEIHNALATDGRFSSTTESFWFATPELSSGTHTVAVTAYDLVGNSCATTGSYSLDPSLQVIERVEILDQDRRTAISHLYISDGHTARVRAAMNDPSLEPYEIRADLRGLGGGAKVQPDAYDRSVAEWTVRDIVTSPTDGQVTVPVSARINGVVTTTTNGYTTADNTPPDLAIDEPTSGTWNSGATTVTWSSVAQDLAASIGLADFEAFGAAEPTTFSLATGDMLTSPGRYLLEAKAWDNADNVATPPVFAAFGIDPNDPSISVSGLVPALQDLTTVTVTGSAWDDGESGFTGAPPAFTSGSIRRKLDAGEWVPLGSDGMADASDPSDATKVNYTIALPDVSETTHTLIVEASDLAGNRSSASTWFVIDRSGPAITIDSPTSGSLLSGDLYLEIEVADPLAGIDAVEFLVDQLDEEWASLPKTQGDAFNATHSLTLDSTLFYDRATTISFWAADAIGNETEERVAVAIDNDVPPQAPTGLEGGYVSYSAIKLTWNLNTEPDFKEYALYRAESADFASSTCLSALGEAGGAGEGLITPTFTDASISTTTPGVYHYLALSADWAGNVSLPSDAIRIDAPRAPKNLRAIGRNGQADLTWDEAPEEFATRYRVYGRATGGEFSSLGETNARTDTSFITSPCANGTTYRFYVVALDGADNESEASNQVSATPNEVASVEDVCVVTFEDLKGQGTVDWDYNDIAVRMETTLYLTANDDVSTIAILAKAVEKDAGYRHKFQLDIVDLQSTASVDIKRYNASDALISSVSDFVYAWKGANGPIVVIPDTLSGAPGAKNCWTEIEIVLSWPADNPLSAFDKPPFDAWIYVYDTGKETHVFDPETGNYAEDNQQVVNDPHLEGVFLSFGLKIPRYDWVPPGGRLWMAYPDFVDYAKSVRTVEIRNPSWYDNPAN